MSEEVTKQKDVLIEEYKEYFETAVNDGKKILLEKKDILLPIFADLAEGQISLLSPSESDQKYGKEMLASAKRSFEDQIDALQAELGNVFLEGIINGLRAIFTKFFIPILLKSFLA